MLPRQHKLTSPQQFRRVTKKGRRAGSRSVIAHCYQQQGSETLAVSGPRFGLIVSKSIGNAVVRHRTARQLRHICRELCVELDPAVDVVVRALPALVDAEPQQLRKDVRSAVFRALKKLEKTSAHIAPNASTAKNAETATQ
ncbi:ribonuclease P protein component [Corynebacterium pseudodiphtheriticum]|uniref:ribonuclease P protein component n=1 Tax=Corynebacterium pseudodiphtheriticum TaxID=37637 RepID=UPI00234CF50F|nr:ribonuclease P protein component [Corynebacterium pseudodiphtheriticum]MDC7112763.1 ribonuclease P protein component [Corynebacterium pseudodiphtheriticum]